MQAPRNDDNKRDGLPPLVKASLVAMATIFVCSLATLCGILGGRGDFAWIVPDGAWGAVAGVAGGLGMGLWIALPLWFAVVRWSWVTKLVSVMLWLTLSGFVLIYFYENDVAAVVPVVRQALLFASALLGISLIGMWVARAIGMRMR